MALTIWTDIAYWLSSPTGEAVLWTVLAVVSAVVIYLLLRKRIVPQRPGEEIPRKPSRLLALCLLFVLLFILMRIWTGILLPPEEAPATRVRILLERLLWTLGVGAGIYILVAGVQKALLRKVTDIESRHRIRTGSSWIGIAVFLIVAGLMWAAGIRNLGVFLGIIGAGVALSLQEALLCIAGWLLFIVRRPFDIGDRIEIDKRIGDVIAVSVFQTSLLEVGEWIHADQSTGRMLIIPNSMLFRHPVHNYSKGFPFVWDELSVMVTFESDWEEAEKLILEKAEVEAERIEDQVRRQIKRMQARYAIHYEQLTPTVYTTIAENGVELTLRYLCPVRERRTITHRISRNVLGALIAHPKIDFAYATTRIFRNTEEGKPGMGGPPPRRTRRSKGTGL